MIVDQTGAHPADAQAQHLHESIDKRGKMHYTKLSDAVPNTEDQVNFYGVIIDAGHPYKGQNKYISTIKVVD